MAQSTFSQRFKNILKHYDVSSSEAARRMEVGRQVTDSYRNGTLPCLDKLVKIMETFPDLNTDWVVFGRGAMLKTGDSRVDEPIQVYGEYVRKSDYDRLEKLCDMTMAALESCQQELRDIKGGSKSKTAG